MYLVTFINKKMVFVMMDTRASHNFIDKRMIKSLGLKVSEQLSRIKSLIFQAWLVLGMACVVDVKLGD